MMDRVESLQSEALLDDDFEMDELLSEFADEEKKNIITFTDSEDELDSLVAEFATTQSDVDEDEQKPGTQIILSDDDEMDGLLEEFREEDNIEKCLASLKQENDITCDNHDENKSIFICDSQKTNGTFFDSEVEIEVSDESTKLTNEMPEILNLSNSATDESPLTSSKVLNCDFGSDILKNELTKDCLNNMNKLNGSEITQDSNTEGKTIYAYSEFLTSSNLSHKNSLKESICNKDNINQKDLNSESEIIAQRVKFEKENPGFSKNDLCNSSDKIVPCHKINKENVNLCEVDAKQPVNESSNVLSLSKISECSKSVEHVDSFVKSSNEHNHNANEFLSPGVTEIKILNVESLSDSDNSTVTEVSSEKVIQCNNLDVSSTNNSEESAVMSLTNNRNNFTHVSLGLDENVEEVKDQEKASHVLSSVNDITTSSSFQVDCEKKPVPVCDSEVLYEDKSSSIETEAKTCTLLETKLLNASENTAQTENCVSSEKCLSDTYVDAAEADNCLSLEKESSNQGTLEIEGSSSNIKNISIENEDTNSKSVSLPEEAQQIANDFALPLTKVTKEESEAVCLTSDDKNISSKESIEKSEAVCFKSDDDKNSISSKRSIEKSEAVCLTSDDDKNNISSKGSIEKSEAVCLKSDDNKNSISSKRSIEKSEAVCLKSDDDENSISSKGSIEKSEALCLKSDSIPTEESLSISTDTELKDKVLEEASKCNGCKSLLTDSRKRKLEFFDCKNDTKKKKEETAYTNYKKTDANCELTSSVKNLTVVNKIKEIIPLNPSQKVRVSKKVLDEIAVYVFGRFFDDNFSEQINEAKTVIKQLEEKLEHLDQESNFYHLMRKEFLSSQRITYASNKYEKKTTRTVGINVKIIKTKEVEMHKRANLGKEKEENTKNDNETIPRTVGLNVKILSTKGMGEEKKKEPILSKSETSKNDTGIEEKKEVPILQKTEASKNLLPKGTHTTHNVPKLGKEAVIFKVPTKIPPPNVVMSGNRLIPYLNPVKHLKNVSPSTQGVIPPVTEIAFTMKDAQLDSSNKVQPEQNAHKGPVKSSNEGAILSDGTRFSVPFNEFLQMLPPKTKESVLPLQTAALPVTSLSTNLTRSFKSVMSQDYGAVRNPYVPQIQQNKSVQFRNPPQGHVMTSSANSILSKCLGMDPRPPNVHLRNPFQLNHPQSQQGPVVTKNYHPLSFHQPGVTAYNPLLSLHNFNQSTVSVHHSPITSHQFRNFAYSANNPPSSLQYPPTSQQHPVTTMNPFSSFMQHTPTSQHHPVTPMNNFLSLTQHTPTPQHHPVNPLNNFPSLMQHTPTPQHHPVTPMNNFQSVMQQLLQNAPISQQHPATTMNNIPSPMQQNPTSNPYPTNSVNQPLFSAQCTTQTHSENTMKFPFKQPSTSPPKPTTVPISHSETATNHSSDSKTIPPLPEENSQSDSNKKSLPPKPELKVCKKDDGKSVMLSWNLSADAQPSISKYQIFSCHVKNAVEVPPSWKKIGDIPTMPLPMAVTLQQFESKNTYHFIVRAVDNSKRHGPFSNTASVYF